MVGEPTHGPGYIPARALIPTIVVILLIWVNGTMPDTKDDGVCPAGTDGPQFECWLRDHPEQLEDR